MIGWSKQIIYLLCIFEISAASPTRTPHIIEDEDEIKFQNKLPEDTLDSQNTLIGKPLNTTKHRIGQLGSEQSILRENEKNHCPFCQYAAKTDKSLENEDQNSDSSKPYLIIGNIQPVVRQPNVITQEEASNDYNNSTWNPQNEIRAILKIPDGNSSSNGKEFKRCTHIDGILGGGLQNRELGNNILNDSVAFNNIDISCCSTLRRIILNVLKLEGKCSCLEHRATSPVINITTIKDNEFEKEVSRQELLPILSRQQQTTPSQTFNEEKRVGHNSHKNTLEHNRDNNEIDIMGIQNKQTSINDTSLDNGMQEWTAISDGSNVTVSETANVSLNPGEKIKDFDANDLFGSTIYVKQRIESENAPATLKTHNSLITENRAHIASSSEVRKEHVPNGKSNLSSTVSGPGTAPPAVGISSENKNNFSKESNKKCEQVEHDPRGTLEGRHYEPTNDSNNGALGLLGFHDFYTGSLIELNDNYKKEDNIDKSNEVTNNYTTEYVLLPMGSDKPNSTDSDHHSLGIKSPFNASAAESEEELESWSSNIDPDVSIRAEGGDDLQRATAIKHNLLHTKQPSEKESSILKQESFLKNTKNQSLSTMVLDENELSTTSPAEDWPGMTTMAYELSRKLESDEILLQPKHDLDSHIALEEDSFIISTTTPKMLTAHLTISHQTTIESNKTVNFNGFTDENKDFQGISNYSNVLDGRDERLKLQDVEDVDFLGKFYSSESIVQKTQTQFTGTPVENQISNLNEEYSVEMTPSSCPEASSTHQLFLSRQNSFGAESAVQQPQPAETAISHQITEGSADITSTDYLREYQPPRFRENLLRTESILQQTKSTDTQMVNLSTENTLKINNSSEPLTNRVEYFPKELVLNTESILQQTQTTDIILESEISTENPSYSNSNDLIENYHLSHPEEIPINHQKIEEQSKNGQDILLDELNTNNMLRSIQTGETESETLSYKWISTLGSDSLDNINVEAEATTKVLEANLLSKLIDSTYQKPINMNSSDDIIESELQSMNKMDSNEFSNEITTEIYFELENSTEIYLELEKTEKILKTFIDGLKKTHFDEKFTNPRVEENPEMGKTPLEKYFAPLEKINEWKLFIKDYEKDMETYTETNKNIELEQYFNNSSSSSNDDSLQGQQNSSTRTEKELLESTATDYKLPAIQDSSKINNTTSSFNNEVDFYENLAKINDFDTIKSLEGSGSTSSPEAPDARGTLEDSSPSIIKLLYPHTADDVELPLVTNSTKLTSNELELQRASNMDEGGNEQVILKPNLGSAMSEEVETAILKAKNEEDEPILSSSFIEQTTKTSEWNDAAKVEHKIKPIISTSLSSDSELPVNHLDSTDLEAEILSTGNYQVHDVNGSKYEDSEDINYTLQETSKPNLESNNMILEKFETTTMMTNNQDNTINSTLTGFSNLNSSLGPQNSKISKSKSNTPIKSNNDNTNLTETLTTTEISELKINFPVTVCVTDQGHWNNDLLSSRFFAQNEANVVEFELVQRNVSHCECPHTSYELKPKSRVSKSDLNLLKSFQGQHISKILRRAHTIQDKTNDRHDTTTENIYLQIIELDSDGKKMGVVMNTLDKTEPKNEDSGNQELKDYRTDDHREYGKLNENQSCKCKCSNHLDPSREYFGNQEYSQGSKEIEIHRDKNGKSKLQNKNLESNGESENIMRLDSQKSEHRGKANNRSKYNRSHHQSSIRRDFPIMIDKDILKRFISVYRPHNYFRRS